MKLNLSIGRKLFLSHMLAVLLVSASVGTYFYYSATEDLMKGLQSRLQNSAALISRTLDARELADIKDKNDVAHPAYRKYLSMLRSFRQTNPDIAYMYVMRRVGTKAYFVLDSDETEKQALPGQEYDYRVPTLYQGFFKASVDDKIYTDEWGSTFSGYAPLANGNGQFLVGIDMDAREVKNKFRGLQITGILAVMISVILALVFSRFLSSRFVSSIQVFVSRCRAIAKGYPDERLLIRTGDELDELAEAFNGMSMDLEKAQEESRQARDNLKRSNEDLEKSVKERTKDLVEMNDRLTQEISERERVDSERERTVVELQEAMAKVKVLKGLLPICASCKKIRNDEGYWQQIESYIRDHSEAEFSHGICPDCVKSLYPGLFSKKE